MKRTVAWALLGVAGMMAAVLYPAVANAQQAQSTNYSVDEVFFGTGGELDASSANYRARQSAGELGVGEASSGSYRAQGGQNTDREEYIEFIVNASSTNLGVLSASSTASTTGSFSIKTYLANGGVSIINAGDPPRYSTYTFGGLTGSSNASTIGSEQFGMNLVANTTPAVGSNPVRGNGSDDNTTPYFSYYSNPASAIASGYGTPNSYRYVKGETIVSVPASTGKMSFTTAYIYNITGSTPAGNYQFDHQMVATATY